MSPPLRWTSFGHCHLVVKIRRISFSLREINQVGDLSFSFYFRCWQPNVFLWSDNTSTLVFSILIFVSGDLLCLSWKHFEIWNSCNQWEWLLTVHNWERPTWKCTVRRMKRQSFCQKDTCQTSYYRDSIFVTAMLLRQTYLDKKTDSLSIILIYFTFNYPGVPRFDESPTQLHSFVSQWWSDDNQRQECCFSSA